VTDRCASPARRQPAPGLLQPRAPCVAAESAPEGVTIEPLEIRDLPHYDADLDVDGGPDVVRAFKAHR
jgi:hypothetical protein